MNISLALKNPEQSFSFEQSIELPPMIVLDDPVSFEAVTIHGQYMGVDGSVSVRGHVEGRLISRCSLCLEQAVLPISTEVDVLYSHEPGEDDPDVYPMDEYTLDLEPMVREALLLELPLRVLCAEDCKGLCPTCGNHLNTAPCTCQESGGRRNPFSALSELLIKDEEV